MNLDTTPRESWIDPAQKSIAKDMKTMFKMSDSELIMLGISTLLELHTVQRRYLTPQEEALRLSINRRLT